MWLKKMTFTKIEKIMIFSPKTVIENGAVNCIIHSTSVDYRLLMIALSTNVNYGQMDLNSVTKLVATRPYLKITYHFKTNRFTYCLMVSFEPTSITLPYIYRVNIHNYIKKSYFGIVKKTRSEKFDITYNEDFQLT